MTNHSPEKPKNRYKGLISKLIRYDLIALFLSAACLVFIVIVVYAVGGKNPTIESTYNYCHEEIQNAVNGYSENHNGALPLFSGTYTNGDCSNCNVLNLSALMIANDGTLRGVPDGIYLGNISGADNCDAVEGIGCNEEYSYIWIVDTNGDVYSYCTGDDCTTNNSGYQDVWP